MNLYERGNPVGRQARVAAAEGGYVYGVVLSARDDGLVAEFRIDDPTIEGVDTFFVETCHLEWV